MTDCSICDDFKKYIAIVKASTIPDPDKTDLLNFLQDRRESHVANSVPW